PTIEYSDGMEPPEQAVNRAFELIKKPGLVAVVDPFGSREALVAGPVYTAAGIPLLLPSASSDLLTTLGPGVFRLLPDNSSQGAFMARYAARDLASRSALLLYENDEYGMGLRKAIAAEAETLGLVVEAEIPMLAGLSVDFRSVLTEALREHSPDVVFAALRTSAEMNVALTALRELTPDSRVIVSDSPTVVETMLKGLPDETAESVYRVVTWDQSISPVASARFAAGFERAAGHAPSHHAAKVHDALNLIVAALRDGATTPEKMHAWLEGLGRDRPAFPGLTGPIEFRAGQGGNWYMQHLESDSIPGPSEGTGQPTR
ncbi:MAG: ABC transporter substrate-binding protein, partial [Pseudomonadales bacterium]|nr:ABC transporter substrate-binding protein [Pseudomonadales bacterium]